MDGFTKTQIVEATKRTFEIAQRDMSREDYIDACEELAEEFTNRADAAREDQAAEEGE